MWIPSGVKVPLQHGLGLLELQDFALRKPVNFGSQPGLCDVMTSFCGPSSRADVRVYVKLRPGAKLSHLAR